jgi:hypothetical protein
MMVFKDVACDVVNNGASEVDGGIFLLCGDNALGMDE